MNVDVTRRCCCGCCWIDHDPGLCTGCGVCCGFHPPEAPAPVHRALDVVAPHRCGGCGAVVCATPDPRIAEGDCDAVYIDTFDHRCGCCERWVVGLMPRRTA